jgi:Ca2+-binding EF-hand superfamily protein
MKGLFLLCFCATVFVLASCATGLKRVATPEQLFRRADADGDGTVSRKEFGDFMVGQVFEFYDRGGKGYVTMDDFIQGGGTADTFRAINRSGTGKVTLGEAMQSRLVRETMVVPFDEADVDRSGSVSLEEFLAYKQRAQPYTR